MPAPVVDTTPSAQGKRKRSQKEKTPASLGSKRVKSIHDDITDNDINATPVPVKQANSSATSSAQKDKKKDLVDTPSKPVKQEKLKSKSKTEQDNAVTVAAQAGEKPKRLRRAPNKPRRSLAAPSALKETTVASSNGTWTASKPICGRFIAHDPIVSADDNYVFVSNGREVQVLSVATSLVERVLPGPDNSVTSFALSPTDPETMYIASSSRRVQCWEWISGAVIDDPIEYKGRVHALCATASDDGASDLLYTICQIEEDWSIMTGDRTIYSSQEPLTNLSLEGSYIIASSATKLVVGQRIAPKADSDEEANFTFVDIASPIAITGLAARVQTIEATKKKSDSADSITVAAGNVEGQIMVYENVLSPVKPGTTLIPRVLHWHREAVASLKWSQDGNYIISGGRETTLVLWQLVTGKKQFLPHLGAEIERLTVSPSGTSYAVQLADNSIMVLSTTELKPVANFAGLQAQTVVQSDSGKITTPAAATLHPLHKNQLLLAVPASQRASSRPFLQTYDITSDRHISRQALTRNNITDFNKGPEGNRIQVPDVTMIKLSIDGQWLATVEEWAPPVADLDYISSDRKQSVRREVYLKFWRWDGDRAVWALETRIDNPHQIIDGALPGRIFGLLSDPAENGFATVGEDGSVRVWKPKTRLRSGLVVRGANAEGLVDWSCRHTIQLDQSVNLTEEDSTSALVPRPKSAAFAYSEDGSMLAASQVFEETSVPPVVHFINTASGAIEQTRASLFTGAIKALDFLDRNLILVSDSSIGVWDVIDETLKYRTGLAAEAGSNALLLAVNQEDRTFAVSLASSSVSRIRVYNLSSANPELMRNMNKPISALLTIPGQRGYTVLTTGAEIQTLHPKASAFRLPTTTVASNAVVASEVSEDIEQEEEDADMEIAESEDVLALDEEEADKPVVRPEELARIFEAENIALMPVRDMFDAVIGLYARKPRPTVVA